MFVLSRRMLRRFADVLATPVRKDRGRGGILIQAYRGYGSTHEIYLMGRVFRQLRIGYRLHLKSWRRDLLDVFRRTLRWGVGDAVLRVQVGDPGTNDWPTHRIHTDQDGYFHLRLRFETPLPTDRRWLPVHLQLITPACQAEHGSESLVSHHDERDHDERELGESDLGASVTGEVYLPPVTARRVIISDIDDTVMHTGVLNKAKMMWRLFMQGAESRVAFPGVAAFYRALYQGPSGDELNPMLYVSRAPWSIYEVLEEFFNLHHIPVGPILFLREWGLTLQRPLPRRAEDHKLELIREMLEIYQAYPFVLIGDSGQHDAEIYTRIVRENPGRVEAVYIRNVSPSAGRAEAIQTLAQQVVDNGSTLMLAADSFSMAKHAAQHHLIDSDALLEILTEERSDTEDQPSPAHRRVQTIEPQPGEDVAAMLEQSGLSQRLDQHDDAGLTPNIDVESPQ